MKKSVIFVVLLMISFSLVSAKTVDIPEVKQGDLTPEGGLPESLVQEGITRYVYSGNSLVASQDNDGIKYYHQDRLGSNRIVTDSLGNKDSEFLSLPFGQSVVDGVKYGFTGKEKDESGLHYFGARYYDSNLGRFSSRDLVPSEPAYQYVGNNPMNFVDPSGMWGFKSTERLWKESWASDHGGGEQASNMFWLELPRALLADVIYNLPGSNANRLDSPDMARKDAKFVEFVGSSAGLVAGASAPRVASPGLGRGMPLRNKDLTNILNKELGGGKASLDDIESALLRISDRGDLDPLSARAFIEETKALAYRDIDGLTITPHTAVRFVIRASEKGLGATADDVAQLGTSYIEEMIYFGNSRPLESGARSFTHDGFRLILDIPSKEIKTFEILHKYGR